MPTEKTSSCAPSRINRIAFGVYYPQMVREDPHWDVILDVSASVVSTTFEGEPYCKSLVRALTEDVVESFGEPVESLDSSFIDSTVDLVDMVLNSPVNERFRVLINDPKAFYDIPDILVTNDHFTFYTVNKYE